MSAFAERLPDAEALYARGRQQRANRDNDGAEASYREALRLNPDFHEAWISLGILLKQTGRLAEAEAAQRTALQAAPGSFLALLNLGNVLYAQRRLSEAEAAFRSAARAHPQCAEAHNNLGRLLLDQQRHIEAASHFAEALRIQPNYFEAVASLGSALLQMDQYEAAIEALNRAHVLRPEDIETTRQFGLACSGAGQYSRAAGLFESLLARQPRDREARFDLALVQFYGGQYTRPRATLENLLAERHDDHVAMAYASLLLGAGEFREGWRHYQGRWALGEPGEPGEHRFPEPRWQGEPLAGKTLLIAREQGLGDEIMFASIIPEILPLAAHCIIECEQRLVDLYRRSFPGATVIGVCQTDTAWHTRLDAARDTLPRFDCWAPLGDLARFRRNNVADFPGHVGYLRCDAGRANEFRDRLGTHAGGALKVGIGWRGGTARTRAGQRSLTLEELRPLLSLPDAHFVSLQYGPCQGEIDDFRRKTGLRIEHWQETVDDIDDTAALVSSLDLVISVCSAVIHIAGSLGRPAWVLAPLVPEWRYGRDGESMIWYPSVRMFRQDKSRDWSKVITQIRRALTRERGARPAGTGAA